MKEGRDGGRLETEQGCWGVDCRGQQLKMEGLNGVMASARLW